MRYFSIRVLILKKITVGNLPHLEATETQLTKEAKEERNFAFRAFCILRVFLLDNRDKFQDEFSLVKRNICTTKWRLAHAKYGDLWNLGGKL